MVVDTCLVKAEDASELEWAWTEQALQTPSMRERSGSLEKLPQVEVELGGQLLVTTSILSMVRLSALHDWHPSPNGQFDGLEISSIAARNSSLLP